jgi:hypothetical protein
VALRRVKTPARPPGASRFLGSPALSDDVTAAVYRRQEIR